MFSLMFQKLLHKKWMVACMLLGNVLLIAVAVSQPLYRVSAFQRMLTDDFEDYYETNGTWPAVLFVSQHTIKNISNSPLEKTEKAFNDALDAIGIPVSRRITTFGLSSGRVLPQEIRDNKKEKKMYLSAMSDLRGHVEIVQGQFPETGKAADGCYEVMLSESAMVELDVLLGDIFTYDLFTDTQGNDISIRITGVFRPLDASDNYWTRAFTDMDKRVFLDMDTFCSLFVDDGKDLGYGLDAYWTACWDYRQIPISKVSDYLNAYRGVQSWSSLEKKVNAEVFCNILTQYSANAKKVELTLTILQIPVLLLLCSFLFMISGQMLDMERNEISLLKSRGAKKSQIFSLYLFQSLFLSLFALLPGVPLGLALCRLLGKATAFLEFHGTHPLPLIFTADILVYVAAAILLSVIMTALPVISYSDVSIVNLKQSRSLKHTSLWKKACLDLICLTVSLYGFYSYRRNTGVVMEDVLTGKGMDPLLYISFSLFILGCSLFVCRLQPLLLRLIYRLTSKRLRPAAYTAFLSAIQTGSRQEFMIVFMMLTIAIGISNTTIARTIIANSNANLSYRNGAEIVLTEKFRTNADLINSGLADKLVYTEPEFSKYQTIDDITAVTRVQRETVTLKTSGSPSVQLMGIQTGSFAEVADLRDGLLPYDYRTYLNVLAGDGNGFLVSENFMTRLGYRLGDYITLENVHKGSVGGYIRGFFPYWPGFIPSEYSLNEYGEAEETENYLIVANLHSLQKSAGVRPYEVWIATDDGGRELTEWMTEHTEVLLTSFRNTTEQIAEMAETTLIQGTSGILSMSFLVVLILCCTGYLIYWILSIRSRELLFGVLRAMGMRKREIVWMLIIEQIFSGLFAIVSGGVIGLLSSRMFVPMIQNAYAAADQVLPLKLISDRADLIQLFAVIAVVICLCLTVLARIVSRMNISKALKLGED
ncbi:MAG: ABC transporter permease [bacterium]|nr:ABC transporter permease [bacterium]